VYSPALTTLLDQALTRLDDELRSAMPGSAPQIIAWTEQLAGASSRRHYFQHPVAFPSLLLPWWVLHRILTPRQVADLDMQATLVYSTVNGYYYIRLIDNIMDAHAAVEKQLLPALNFFHTQFQSAYQLFFSAGHPFWPVFRQIWFLSAEMAIEGNIIASKKENRTLVQLAINSSSSRPTIPKSSKPNVPLSSITKIFPIR